MNNVPFSKFNMVGIAIGVLDARHHLFRYIPTDTVRSIAERYNIDQLVVVHTPRDKDNDCFIDTLCKNGWRTDNEGSGALVVGYWLAKMNKATKACYRIETPTKIVILADVNEKDVTVGLPVFDYKVVGDIHNKNRLNLTKDLGRGLNIFADYASHLRDKSCGVLVREKSIYVMPYYNSEELMLDKDCGNAAAAVIVACIETDSEYLKNPAKDIRVIYLDYEYSDSIFVSYEKGSDKVFLKAEVRHDHDDFLQESA